MPKQPRPLFDRIVDRLLGVSRRRRRVAFYAIGTGLAMLRPALRRVAYCTTSLAFALLLWRGFG